jgi:hypothetical protein
MLLITSRRKGLPSATRWGAVHPPSIFQDEPVGDDDAANPAASSAATGAALEHEDDSNTAAASSPRSFLRAVRRIDRTIMAIDAALPDLEEWKSPRDVGLLRNIMGMVLAVAARVDLGSCRSRPWGLTLIVVVIIIVGCVGGGIVVTIAVALPDLNSSWRLVGLVLLLIIIPLSSVGRGDIVSLPPLAP